MKEYNCTEKGHHYGLWSIKNGKAVRTCEYCGFTRQLPSDPSIIKQIEKQKLAKKVWESFEQISNEDDNILWYLSCILIDTFPYLESHIKEKLIIRMNELKTMSNISQENKIIFEHIINAIQEKNDKMYWEFLDIFQEQNPNLLNVPMDLLETEIKNPTPEIMDILETPLNEPIKNYSK